MQGQTYHLWVACQEGPGLECRNTYCSCRYAGLTAPAPPPAFLCNGWELYCQNCPFNVSVCAMCMSVRMCVCLCLCVCVRMYVSTVSVCSCVCVYSCMCRRLLFSCLMLCCKSTVTVHACMGRLWAAEACTTMQNCWHLVSPVHTWAPIDLQACWAEEPDKRPDFENIIADLRGMLRCTAATRQRSQALTGTSDLAPNVFSMHCL